MSAVVADIAEASAGLNRILRGNYQQAADAWARIEPQLGSYAAGLAGAIKRSSIARATRRRGVTRRTPRISGPCCAVVYRCDSALAQRSTGGAPK